MMSQRCEPDKPRKAHSTRKSERRKADEGWTVAWVGSWLLECKDTRARGCAEGAAGGRTRRMVDAARKKTAKSHRLNPAPSITFRPGDRVGKQDVEHAWGNLAFQVDVLQTRTYSPLFAF